MKTLKPYSERVWVINGETVDSMALDRVEPETEPHGFVPGNHVTGCQLCGVSNGNAVHSVVDRGREVAAPSTTE